MSEELTFTFEIVKGVRISTETEWRRSRYIEIVITWKKMFSALPSNIKLSKLKETARALSCLLWGFWSEAVMTLSGPCL